jgi:hypothetical protein
MPVSRYAASLGQLRFYPNPAGKQVWIDAPTNLAGVFTLTDSKGLQMAVYPAGTKLIPLDHLAPGVYFITYSGREGKKIERVVHAL